MKTFYANYAIPQIKSKHYQQLQNSSEKGSQPHSPPLILSTSPQNHLILISKPLILPALPLNSMGKSA